jgi:hypothetical protein
MSDDNQIKDDSQYTDIVGMTFEERLDEFFKLKGVLKTLRNDLKDLKVQNEFYSEWEELAKKAKELSDIIKEDENIRLVREKISTVNERMALIKELIRIDMIEKGMEEFKKDGKKLRLVNVVKEMKDDDKKKL